MRLLQLNTWGGRLMDSIAALAQDLQPDIVCLQEVISTELPMVFGTLQDFQAQLHYPAEFFSPTFHFEVMGADAEFGNCILARSPLAESRTTFTNLEYARGFSFSSHDYNIRNFQHARLDTAYGRLNVVNVHGLQVAQHKNGTPETERHCAELAGYLERLTDPVIVTGDFNLAPTSESLKPIDSLLVNQSVRAGLTSTRTQFSRKTEVCDYVFTSESIRVDGFAQRPELVSDHSALVLDFEF